MHIRIRAHALLAVAFLAAALLTLTLAAAPLHAQTNSLHTASQQELDVVKLLLKQETAWNRGDLDAFTAEYKNSPDTLFIGRQVSRGYDQMIADYHRNYPSRDAMGDLAFSDLEVHTLDENVAVCIGKYHLERNKKNGGNADGIFSLVLQKTDSGWKIVVDHTT
jgi:ketosteroid isomerase-like protein